MSVDLRQCKPGDKLLTQHGTILEYVGPNKKYFREEYPHSVRYPDGATGSRTDNGVAWIIDDGLSEYDIVEILK